MYCMYTNNTMGSELKEVFVLVWNIFFSPCHYHRFPHTHFAPFISEIYYQPSESTDYIVICHKDGHKKYYKTKTWATFSLLFMVWLFCFLAYASILYHCYTTEIINRNDCLRFWLSEWLIHLFDWHSLDRSSIVYLCLFWVLIYFSWQICCNMKKKSINLSYIFVRIPLIISCEMFKVITYLESRFYHARLRSQSLRKTSGWKMEFQDVSVHS